MRDWVMGMMLIIACVICFALAQQPHASAQQSAQPIGKIVATCPAGGVIDHLAIAARSEGDMSDQIAYDCTGTDGQRYVRLVTP